MKMSIKREHGLTTIEGMDNVLDLASRILYKLNTISAEVELSNKNITHFTKNQCMRLCTHLMKITLEFKKKVEKDSFSEDITF